MREKNERNIEKSGPSPLSDAPAPSGRGFVPKTDFGRELLELKRKAIADGMKMRTVEEILADIEDSRRP
jgi:hypothetical protein